MVKAILFDFDGVLTIDATGSQSICNYVCKEINMDMLELVKKIKCKGYKTAMVTDNKADRIEKITEHFAFEKIFDVIVVSANIGSGKDKEDIFIRTMEKLKVTADECVFIDNQQNNLLISEKLGMKVIFYNHEEKNIDRLQKQLVSLGLNF